MKSDQKQKSRLKKTEYEKLLSGYMEIWIVYILKTYSSIEKPLTKKEVADKVSKLINLDMEKNTADSENTIERTVGRRLSELEMMGNLFGGNTKNSFVADSFYKVMGGRVRSVNERPVKFYFESILEPGEVSMICAAVESNHYLSDDEINYLVQRECVALGYREDENYYPIDIKEGKVNKLPKKPVANETENLPPSKASVTLKKIAILQYAIRKQLKIKVVPGTYETRNHKICFVPKSDTASVLNPYAFVSQNGQYYIIVTHEGYDNPTHYRVDRLYSVELCRNEDEGARTRYKKRDEVPLKLQRFFFRGGKFKADEYTATYPLMAYYGDAGVKKCQFLCYRDAITVAIDYFGVGESVNVQDVDDDFVKFTVLADYDNVKRFCIQQYSIVKPLAPKELVLETKQYSVN